MGIFDEAIVKVLNDNEEKLADKTPDELDSIMKSLFTTDIEKISKKLYFELKEDSKNMLVKHRNEEKDFTKLIFKQWGEAFDILETIIVISLESCEIFCRDFGEKAQEENNKLFYALKAIHARAIQIAKECLLLLRNGYADGALARWRTIHELNVISHFLTQYYSEELIEMYLAHGGVEEYKEELSYRKNAKVRKRYTDDAFNEMKKQFIELKNKYGIPFTKSNGWAYKVLKKEKVYFSDIELATDFVHMKSYYNTACNTIHSGHNGNVNKIGLLPNHKDILLCGPTNYGISIPCQNVAISLVGLTINFLTIYLSADSIVSSYIMKNFLDGLMPLCNKIQIDIEQSCNNVIKNEN